MENKRDSFFLNNKKQNPSKVQDKKEFKNKNDRQKKFDENRSGLDDKKEGEKKPFDKKAYRLKKYSKKYKLEKWEEQRKKRMLREYQKNTKDDPMTGSYKPISFDGDTIDANSNIGRFVKHPDILEKEIENARKTDPYTRAKEKFNRIKQEKIEKQQAMEKAKQERMQKLQEYKKKKNERFKKLSKKTKKGQPVMTGRLELLLEKIQGSK
ncbi:unnamed protein product [Euphydryas editha]|uniref:Thyroid transcription factor 1-associated protein 26 n=1 Tax=Euphydryas editha TaxID=104508 RepID=A0AAU9UIM4_EUPED|nr:unnamed protein product [Euphydryas editha]